MADERHDDIRVMLLGRVEETTNYRLMINTMRHTITLPFGSMESIREILNRLKSTHVGHPQVIEINTNGSIYAMFRWSEDALSFNVYNEVGPDGLRMAWLFTEVQKRQLIHEWQKAIDEHQQAVEEYARSLKLVNLESENSKLRAEIDDLKSQIKQLETVVQHPNEPQPEEEVNYSEEERRAQFEMLVGLLRDIHRKLSELNRERILHGLPDGDRTA